ncbi:hypothetical protein G6F22_017650 [Rhizopus arrhizus]|nr:hypothetical protein G6F22_017650 [Rhizopus arrhizus]
MGGGGRWFHRQYPRFHPGLADARRFSDPLRLAEQPTQENRVQPRRAGSARPTDRRPGQRRRNAARRAGYLQGRLGKHSARAAGFLCGRHRPVRAPRRHDRRRPLSAGRVRQHGGGRVFPLSHQRREIRLYAHRHPQEISVSRGCGGFRAGKPGVVGGGARGLSQPLHQPRGAHLS